MNWRIGVWCVMFFPAWAAGFLSKLVALTFNTGSTHAREFCAMCVKKR